MNNDYAQMSETDVAYQILKEDSNDTALYYKDLILEVLKRQNRILRYDAQIISEIYTQINMDGRFNFLGQGMWGLSEWVPVETAKRRHKKKDTSSDE